MFLSLVSERPTLKDLANFVVPLASARWYYLGIQLFDSQDIGKLQSMKKEYKTLEDRCTEMFSHWLDTEKNATWKNLIEGLKSRCVNLPNVARNIEKLLGIPVSCISMYSYCLCIS